MNPLEHPTYHWLNAVRIAYDEPGHTNIPGGHNYDFTIGETEAVQTLFDSWDACYPNRCGRN